MTVIRRNRVVTVVLGTLCALLLVTASACSPATNDGPSPTAQKSIASSTAPRPPAGSTPPAGAVPPAAAPAAGVTPVGAKWDWARFDQYRPYLSTLKGGYTYYEFVWCDVEPTQGRRDWSSVDRVVKNTRSLDMTLLLKIRVGKCWATEGAPQYERGANKTESGAPKDLATYRAFITEAVKRYAPQGVTEFALENEVNSPSYWGGTPEQLRALIDTGAAAVRAGSATAKVVDYGLSSTTYGYGIAARKLQAGDTQGAVEAWNRYYERRIGTRGDKIPRVTDAASLQAVLDSEQGRRNLTYLDMATELARSKVIDVRQIHFYEKWSSIPDLMTYLRATTPAGTPIEAWEVGRFLKGPKGGGPDDQSAGASGSAVTDEVMQSMAGLLAGGVRVAIWLPLAVNPQGRNPDEPRYGLVDPSGTVRSAGKVVTELASASRGAQAVPVARDGITGVGYDSAGGSVLFLWGAKKPLSLPSGATMARPGAAQGSGAGTPADPTTPVQVRSSSSVASFLGEQK